MPNKFSKQYGKLEVEKRRTKEHRQVLLEERNQKRSRREMRELTNFDDIIAMESIQNSLYCDSWTINNILPMGHSHYLHIHFIENSRKQNIQLYRTPRIHIAIRSLTLNQSGKLSFNITWKGISLLAQLVGSSSSCN